MHWIHIRTINPLESTFETVRLRTKRQKYLYPEKRPYLWSGNYVVKRKKHGKKSKAPKRPTPRSPSVHRPQLHPPFRVPLPALTMQSVVDFPPHQPHRKPQKPSNHHRFSISNNRQLKQHNPLDSTNKIEYIIICKYDDI